VRGECDSDRIRPSFYFKVLTMDDLIRRFAELFSGYTGAFGAYNNVSSTPNPEGKLLGSDRRTVRKPVEIGMYKAHVNGESGLGIMPIRADNSAAFGAIDVDVYDGLNHAETAKRIARLKLPLVVCRSKSGGAHIFGFASVPIPAGLMLKKLREIAALLGHGGAECFPKQQTVAWERGELASWLNLPYYNGLLAARYAINPDDGEPLSLAEFVQLAESLRQPQEWFQAPLAARPDLPQGPPCLQHLVQLGFPPGTRNQGLFDLGVYAKKSDPDAWEASLDALNQKYMEPPLGSEEVSQIKKSLRKKAYQYRCGDQPILAHCDKALCRSRKFGVGNADQLPELGSLTKMSGDPVVWFWEVEGKRIELSTKELQDPFSFQRKCMDVLTVMPPIPKRDVWESTVRDAMKTANEVPAPEDSTTIGRFRGMLQKFCTGRARAMSMDEILLGKPFTDEKYTYFRLCDFLAFLDRQRFREVDVGTVYLRLKDVGGENIGRRRLKGVREHLWRVASFEEQSQAFDVPAGTPADATF
jgi:hypothetical protein